MSAQTSAVRLRLVLPGRYSKRTDVRSRRQHDDHHTHTGSARVLPPLLRGEQGRHSSPRTREQTMPLPPWVGKLADGRTARVLERRNDGSKSEDVRCDSVLPTDLKPMDDLCVRWSQQAFDWEKRNANPIYWMMRQAEGAPLPGGEEVMQDDVLALDGAIRRSHEAVYALMYVWYCTGGSVEQKASRLN